MYRFANTNWLALALPNLSVLRAGFGVVRGRSAAGCYSRFAAGSIVAREARGGQGKGARGTSLFVTQLECQRAHRLRAGQHAIPQTSGFVQAIK